MLGALMFEDLAQTFMNSVDFQLMFEYLHYNSCFVVTVTNVLYFTNDRICKGNFWCGK